ncbi:YceI family protein [Amaricoccus solimangrovi]|uniref:Polyisoprenoid-binding protein n=1 Tax=Amaricoccus solimangrovi TaxID=2589815 RepID=A0A501WFW7_9RHOB|nr:YceI family protein [Amaricoccus solimangrovi]TPE48298.1 polyisoprenoid-binding protein [Amaricoccus solimangrovi]
MRACLALVLVLLPGFAPAASWHLDPSSTVSVSVPWRGTSVAVRFPELSGQIEFDERAPARARAVIAADTTRATTGVAPVDALVRGAGYLDAAEYPTVTFRLDQLVQTSKSTADVTGRLTLRGVTRPVSFRAKVFRYGPDPADPSRFAAGFDISGAIDRTQFGSTAGAPEVGVVLPVAIHLLMTSD